VSQPTLDSQPTREGELSHDDEPGAGDTITEAERTGVRVPEPPNGEAYETGDRMSGVEENGHGQAILPNDNESDVANEVADPSSYTGSEAGDVVMGHVNDEDVSHTLNPPDIADSDLKGLVDDLADGIEQLNIGRDLLDTPVPSLIRQDGLAHGNSPYWAMVNTPPYSNCFLSADDGSWGSKAVEEEDEDEL